MLHAKMIALSYFLSNFPFINFFDLMRPIQSNLNGSNTFGTMENCSSHG